MSLALASSGAPDGPYPKPTTLRTPGREYGRAVSTDSALLVSVSALPPVSPRLQIRAAASVIGAL